MHGNDLKLFHEWFGKIMRLCGLHNIRFPTDDMSKMVAVEVVCNSKYFKYQRSLSIKYQGRLSSSSYEYPHHSNCAHLGWIRPRKSKVTGKSMCLPKDVLPKTWGTWRHSIEVCHACCLLRTSYGGRGTCSPLNAQKQIGQPKEASPLGNDFRAKLTTKSAAAVAIDAPSGIEWLVSELPTPPAPCNSASRDSMYSMAFRRISTFGRRWFGFDEVRRFNSSNASFTWWRELTSF